MNDFTSVETKLVRRKIFGSWDKIDVASLKCIICGVARVGNNFILIYNMVMVPRDSVQIFYPEAMH